MSPSKQRREQLQELEDRLVRKSDALFAQPRTPAQQAADTRRMLAAFTAQAPAGVQEVYREVALRSADKTDNQVLADLFHAFHARGSDDFTPGEDTLPVIRALAAELA
jgi:hypothetical protein